MDYSLYTIAPETILKWVLIGFAFAFFLKDLQKKMNQSAVNVKAAASIAITISIVSLFLLIGGFDTTIIAILSFGSGIILHLIVFAGYRFLSHFFSKNKQINKRIRSNSNIAKSHISSVNRL